GVLAPGLGGPLLRCVVAAVEESAGSGQPCQGAPGVPGAGCHVASCADSVRSLLLLRVLPGPVPRCSTCRTRGSVRTVVIKPLSKRFNTVSRGVRLCKVVPAAASPIRTNGAVPSTTQTIPAGSAGRRTVGRTCSGTDRLRRRLSNRFRAGTATVAPPSPGASVVNASG